MSTTPRQPALVQARGQIWLCVSLRLASRGMDHVVVEREVRDHLASLLPPWQCPERMLILDELPRSFLAKLLHREVRERIESGAIGSAA